MITILCSGSRGDFQPYIALALELQKLGLDVRITGGRSSEPLIKGYGIGFYPLSADYQDTNIDPEMLRAAQSSDSPLKMLLTFHKMKKYVLGLSEEMYQACEGSDLILYHPGCSIGYFAGESLCIPSVLATPFPLHKTKEVASVIAYGKTKIPAGISYTLLQEMLWMAGKAGIAHLFRKKTGKLPPNFVRPFERVDARHPAIVSCSHYVFPRPKDWNEHIHQNGYWFVEEQHAYEPPEELGTFLANGDKPVYFGFGSVFSPAQRDVLVRILVEATHRCGKRGIISGMGIVPDLPENIISTGSIPHSWLFERVSAVCHHGGAGTTAAGFRAGVPSVIVPFSNDQFAWAHRAHDLGVGSKPVYRKDLTSDKLAEAINFALSDSVVASSQALGQKIASENGARDSAKIVADCLKR